MKIPTYIQQELSYPGPLTIGQKNNAVKKLQEWLSIHHFACEPDGAFGKATLNCLNRFQQHLQLPVSDIVTADCWQQLTAPLQRALAPIAKPSTFPADVMAVARQHLAVHPVEVGGDNKGPWVRIYMEGHEGASWYWCAGFVSFVLKQTCWQLQKKIPIPGSFSCDVIASQGKSAGLFVAEKQASSLEGRPLFIFLIRKSSTDWIHTGFGFAMEDGVFQTIEGNTNNDGSRNGYEVCQRTRTTKGTDFVLLAR